VDERQYVGWDGQQWTTLEELPRIPLPAATVTGIVDALEPYRFARVYGAWYGRVVDDGKAAVRRSAERYVAVLAG
jgi:hypothetical protein